MKSIIGICLVTLSICAAAIGEEAYEQIVNVSLTGGGLKFEGDEAVDDAYAISLHVGLDTTEHWTLEAVLTSLPKLEERFANSYGTRISRLQRTAGAGVDETSAVGLALDALYHFSRWDRLDPYLSIGLGAMHYEHDFDSQTDPVLRVGGGLLYHLSNRFALRADVRVMMAGEDSEVNTLANAGIIWTFAKQTTASPTPAAIDSDADGLTDAEEARVGTNPFEGDSDFDGLSDQDEIEVYKTNPMMRDTDLGKVSDGHEVIEDGTDPLAAGDDLTFFELNMQFEGDGSMIRPEYFADLDAIATVLQGTPAATARIEGHTDPAETSSKHKSKRLTRRRAEAVGAYLEKTWKIDDKRLETIGYGDARPKAANDPKTGNPENRRMEIYIRGNGSES